MEDKFQDRFNQKILKKKICDLKKIGSPKNNSNLEDRYTKSHGETFLSDRFLIRAAVEKTQRLITARSPCIRGRVKKKTLAASLAGWNRFS